MDFRNRIIGYCALTDQEGNRSALDLSNLLSNLLLFDSYILKSREYSELAELVELFGYKGLIKLIKSGALQFDPTRIFAVGSDDHAPGVHDGPQQLKLLFSESGPPPRRVGSFQVTVVRIGEEADAARELHSSAEGLEGLSKNRLNRLEQAVWNATSFRPDGILEPATSQTHIELDRTTFDLSDAISQLLDVGGAHPDPGLIDLRIHREDETYISVESNLVNEFGMREMEAHTVIGNALLALARCNTSLAHMREFSAVTGMPPDQQRFLDRKLGFLTDLVSPESVIGRYQNVMELGGLPAISTGFDSAAIDIDQFLEVRASRQCAEFRQWLRDASPEDATEATESLNSLWRRAIGKLGTSRGRRVRFATTTGLGVLHPPAGIALSALDTFFLDKLLPTSGPSLFLSNEYPSMFVADEGT